MTTPRLSDNFAAALNVACKWHVGQDREVPEGETPTIPCISHLLGVAAIALRATIEEQFGAEVAKLMDGATDAMPKAEEEKEPWQTRKTSYLAKLPQEPAS